MADTFGPFDNANMGETGWSAILDRLRGVLDGSHLVATASGVTARGVDLSPGTALHQGFHYTTDTSREVVSPANTSGSPRVDRVVARVAVAGNTMLPVVLAGTPSGNPSPPSVASTDEPLWRWTVADGAGAVSSIVDERSVLAGLVTSGVRPLVPKPGHVHFESGRWLGWNGSSWVVLHEDTGEVGPLSLFSPVTWTDAFGGSFVRRVGKTVDLRVGMQRTGNSLAADQESTLLILPSGFRPGRTHPVAGYVNNGTVARVDVEPSGAVVIRDSNGQIITNATLVFSHTWMVD